ITGSTLTAGDNYAFELRVTDSASTPETQTSASSQTITTNTALTASAAPTASNSVIDSGQSSTLTVAAPTTGTPPYYYQWYSGASATCTSDSAVAGQTGLTYSASPTSSTYYCVRETDSATTNEIVYTGTTQVAVNSALTAPSAPTVSNTLLDVDQSETVSGTIPSTGTSPYTQGTTTHSN
ncbi:MAG: hypothetical protein LVQ95_02290, partial [Candidatus Micrarchaeales archaeon]|nr:hypothetical protein [Candidatus Micrarchaeales archaeon]